MTTMRLVVAACAILAVAACQQNNAEAAGQQKASSVRPAGPGQASLPAAAPAGKAGRYTIVAAPVTMKPGAKTTVTMRVEPAKGLKFNKDFPSKFIVNAGSHAKCDKANLSKRGGDVKMDGKVGVGTIPLTALAAGAGNLSIIGNFSVCNDEQCFVLRGESLSLSVTGK